MGELKDPFIATKHKIRPNKGDNKSKKKEATQTKLYPKKITLQFTLCLFYFLIEITLSVIPSKNKI